MENIFLTVLNMSLRGAVVIAAVLAARLLLCRAPKRFSYLLWAIVLVRLICPVSFVSSASLIGWLGVPQIGQYADGRYADEQHEEGQYADEQHEEGQYADGRYEEERYAEGRYEEGQYADGRYEEERYAEGQREPSEEADVLAGGILAGEVPGTEQGEGCLAQYEEQGGMGEGPEGLQDPSGEAAPGDGAARRPIREDGVNTSEIVTGAVQPTVGAAGPSGKGMLRIGVILWIAGVAGMLGYNLFLYLRFRRTFREGSFSTPFVYGILQPRIYLPEGLNEKETEYITLHEQIHIRRLDQVWRMLGFLALCVHWFNPMAWLAFFLSGKDMEMSCDEAVVSRLGEGCIKDYSGSLLEFAAGRRLLNGAPLAFGEGDTGSRVRNLLRYRRPAMAVRLLAVAVCCVVAVLLLADPARADRELSGKTDSSVQDGGQDGEQDGGQDGGQDEAARRDVPRDGEKGKADPEDPAQVSGDHEIFKVLEGEGAVFRFCSDGIFQVEGKGESLIWKEDFSADVEPKWHGGRIYWLTDAVSHGIAWMDPKNGEGNKVSLDDVFPYLRDMDSYLLSSVDVEDGFLTLDGEAGAEWQGITCRFPMPSRDVALEMAAQNRDGVLAATEKEAFRSVGRSLSDFLRSEPGIVIDASVRTRDDTYFILDLDGDGQLEEVHLNQGMSYLEGRGDGFGQYSLTVSGTDDRMDRVAGSGGIANSLLAVSLDGEEILIAVYDSGSGGAPRTVFYRYTEDGTLEECGGIAQNIRLSRGQGNVFDGRRKPLDDIEGCRVISDGTIYAWERTQIFQTDEVLYAYRMNGGHKLERVKQKFYALRSGQSCREAVKLLEKLPVCETPGGKYKLHLSPGNVYCTNIAFGADGESAWIYLEGHNGAGWMEIDHFSHVTALDKENWEVFEGLSLGD